MCLEVTKIEGFLFVQVIVECGEKVVGVFVYEINKAPLRTPSFSPMELARSVGLAALSTNTRSWLTFLPVGD